MKKKVKQLPAKTICHNPVIVYSKLCQLRFDTLLFIQYTTPSARFWIFSTAVCLIRVFVKSNANFIDVFYNILHINIFTNLNMITTYRFYQLLYTWLLMFIQNENLNLKKKKGAR